MQHGLSFRMWEITAELLTHLANIENPPFFLLSSEQRGPIAIDSQYLHIWSIPVPDEGENCQLMAFPRRWLDINGRIIPKIWFSGLRNVLGWILNRPGISLVRYLPEYMGLANIGIIARALRSSSPYFP
jgi:hypothetical protein